MRNCRDILCCLLITFLMLGWTDHARAQVEQLPESVTPVTLPATQPLDATTLSTTQASAATTLPTTQVSFGPTAVIVINGGIDDYTHVTLVRRFDEARAQGARTIILKLNTPGGLVSAAMDITRFLRSQDPAQVRTIAFVDEMALSAGAMISVACDQIIMQPGSLIGDSAPIVMAPQGGLSNLGETERAKAESPIQADFYASAIRNGHDPTLLGAMVTLGRVVHYVQHPTTDERKFVEAEAYTKLISEGWTPVKGVPDPVDRADTLFTADAELSKKLGLSKGTYPSIEAFVASRNASGEPMQIIATFQHTTGEQVVAFLGSFPVRGILTTVFMLSLWMSLSQPGTGLPETVALASLGVLMGVPMLTGYAEWWEVLSVVLGIVLLAVELFLIPGFGFAGITGVILLIMGLTMTWVGNEPIEFPGVLPSLPLTWAAAQGGLIMVTMSLLSSIVILVLLRRFLPSMPYFNSLVLKTTVGSTDSSVVALSESEERAWPYRGMHGTAVTSLMPGGSARFTDVDGTQRVLSVVTSDGYIDRGAPIVVREVSGLRVVVRNAPPVQSDAQRSRDGNNPTNGNSPTDGNSSPDGQNSQDQKHSQDGVA